MPKRATELKPIQLKRLVDKPTIGKHAVGGVAGLYLQITSATASSWILRTKVGNKRKEFGLGGYPEIGLAAAKEGAKTIKALIKSGIDPIVERKAAESRVVSQQARAVTFEQVAREYIDKKSSEYKTSKQTQKLEGILCRYAYPFIGRLLVRDIGFSHIEAMLKPIWQEKTETATRLRIHTEGILSLATVKKLREGPNPAQWKNNLDQVLPKPSKIAKVTHYAALPVSDLPAFMTELTTKDWIAGKALEFAILTAARSGEIRGATWSDVDTRAKIWTIPADRMKAGKTHRVPLSDAALSVLSKIPRLSDYLFTGARGGMLSDMAISKTPKRLSCNVTAHGFRSTFKDWARRYTSFPDEVSELALAHVGDDKTRAAYARDELIDKRRLLMNEWAKFCYEGHLPKVSNVIEIGGVADV